MFEFEIPTDKVALHNWKKNLDNMKKDYEKQYFFDKQRVRQEKEELKLRENNPAVKDAWEQYQVILKLNRKG